jgi:hypothetical protein
MKIQGTYKTQIVKVDGKELSPVRSQMVINHSPDGFLWGYHGSGPSQLALALLLTVTDRETAVRFHHTFKYDFVAKLPQSDFETEFDISDWVNRKKREKRYDL